MFDKILRAVQEASDTLREQAGSLGDNAKEKSYQLIDDWLQVFPKLEVYGLEITSLALGVAISPSLEVELKGKHEQFTTDYVQKILDENRSSTAITSVFTTIKTTYALHRKIYATLKEPLIVKIRIKLSPEIKVYIGEPIIQ
ncbi:MAG: hypothetical protein IPN33_20190 [Saprospiraceae bacterium]|jgi:hypothetical protein|nr:hypothetical protein [Saprospiraceae bacterium]